jgi:hypothetical protein
MLPAIAIGGLGGSGTRAVAEILKKAGVFIGDDLNESLDNLLFTRLFKNPVWLAKANTSAIKRRIIAFEDLMKGNRLSAFEILMCRNAFKTNETYPTEASHVKTFMFNQLFFKDRVNVPIWGWKEPNTHVILPSLLDQIKGLKYVHVLRHGLDMAFSSNKQQLLNWGNMFGIEAMPTEAEDVLCRKQLEYWIFSTQRVISLQKNYPNRIKIIKLEELVEKPEQGITDLIDFAELLLKDSLLDELITIPQKTDSFGRYKEKDLAIMTIPLLKSVAELGYAI